MSDDNQQSINAAARQAVWLRLLFMILFVVIGHITGWLVVAVGIFQFLCVVITGQKNAQVADFGDGLSKYLYQIARFISFGGEDKPFPFTDWPGAAPGR
jgi:hypothetical protein